MAELHFNLQDGGPTNIVITMAGRGSRFLRAGYNQPKYSIEAHGQTLFYWSMKSLARFCHPDNRYVFVCLQENDSTAFVTAQCADLNLRDITVFEIEEMSDGQATSAYLSRDQWDLDAPLLIYNIDTYVNPRALHPRDIRPGSDAWAPCFRVAGDHWSFVKIGEDGWATDCAEKRRISDYATVGLYWFSRAADYVGAYDEFFTDPANLVAKERYIAPMYRHYIKQGRKLSIVDLAPSDVHVLGTPAELDLFLALDSAPV